ncbi:sulfite exporter TauE/SafE family protein [Alcaligenes endophyticus]|uniref:Probable membrane transporter protein n=1 Tax=Alcaligenes endophyticus TaxID=1929088 RepID=A0ABT8EGB9_9BURK|nr:sulfite exporter TauE/SafE family protein [Alcaligenes endophyticus]MCX5590019.1 sulfite exporter TauE/SafE family protein [Alcaligenes endophyticus]MDN4120318.1 sulfite exporter TauE/SafE family protein [Alcaligenes endophyticus]
MLALLLGALTGLSLGLTGAGGGILAIPALVLGLGLSLSTATPIALLAVGCAALLGAVDGLRKHIVRYRAALFMAAVGALCTKMGLWLGHHLPERYLLIAFALLMLWIATKMLRSAAKEAIPHTKPCLLNPETGRFHWTARSSATLATIGASAGLFSGMLGVGGGFLIVPSLRRYSNLSMHSIVATSLLLIALVSLSGAAVALSSGAHIPTLGWLFTGAALLGMLFGRAIASHIPAHTLQQGFSILTAVVAVILLIKSLSA